MGLVKLKPYNSASRGTVLVKTENSKNFPLKSQTKGLIKTAGRNNSGKITSYHRGGGNKRLYRYLNILNFSDSFIVESLEYDPNRTALLARLFSTVTKKHFYALAPSKLKIGQIYNARKEIKIGTRVLLRNTPLGSKIHAIGTKFRPSKPILQRSAGTFAQLVQKTEKNCLVKLSSGKIKELTGKTYATLGEVSNPDHRYKILGKAGRKRWLGIRPTTRGVAMNPVDHPHGGGEGKSSGGRPSVTPWAKPAHGKKTKKRI